MGNYNGSRHIASHWIHENRYHSGNGNIKRLPEETPDHTKPYRLGYNRLLEKKIRLDSK